MKSFKSVYDNILLLKTYETWCENLKCFYDKLLFRRNRKFNKIKNSTKLCLRNF